MKKKSKRNSEKNFQNLPLFKKYISQ
jgi:hypothetical protein